MDATVYENSKIKGAATHAIVIGVGHYRHLPGGKGKKAPNTWGLRQLSSPPHSARAIASWLIEEFDHPTKPLASVSLLVADSADSKFSYRAKKKARSVRLRDANFSHVATAVRQWHARGNRNEKNLLLFFFCGHGFELGTDLALLLSDFAADPLAPLDGALDFRRFRAGMEDCAARQQCYFIDACRTESELLTGNLNQAGRPIIQRAGTYNTRSALRQGPVFHSTLAGASAFATKGQPSHYTSALIEALSGAGAGDETGEWQVRTNSLNAALGYLLRDASQRLQLPEAQIIATDDLSEIDLNVVSSARVPVIVTCDPETANRSASFSCESGSSKFKRSPKPGSWRLTIPAGSYDIAVKLRNPLKRTVTRRDFPVRPIYRHLKLKV
jgi:Caspase domain